MKTEDGIRLVYEDRGAGPAVLFVHGWGTNRHVWEGQVRALGGEYRTVTLDWRGCGDSDHPLDGGTVHDIAEDLRQVIDQLGLAPVIAVGSSIGGNAVLDLAVHHPELLRAAVLADAPAHWFADGLDPVEFSDWHRSLSGQRAHVFEQMVHGWFGPGGSDALRAWTLQLLLRSGWCIDDVLASAQTHDLRPALPTLQLPVALIHGAHDHEVPLAVSQATVALLPAGELHVLPDAGHMPALDDPAHFNALLDELLERWSSPHRSVRAS